MNEISSITGREVPHITLTNEDRGRLWVYLYPFVALLPALRHRNWFWVAFWLIGISGFLAISRFGQQRESRTTLQRVFFILLTSIAAILVFVPGSHPVTSRLIGLAIAPIPFAVDVVLAHRRHHD